MAKSRNKLDAIEDVLEANGLINFGPFEFVDGKTGLLVGNAGRQMWDAFCKSIEYSDGKEEPLNRWTRRVISKLSSSIGCEALYPFDRPFPPFQKYAGAAMGAKPSPLGILIHQEFGLWHAFRAVLVFEPEHRLYSEVKVLIQLAEKMIHPCDNCIEKPCLSACPVKAFSPAGLEVDLCFTHLDKGASPNCMAQGCAARSACPIGIRYQYSPEQLAFHMKSYRRK